MIERPLLFCPTKIQQKNKGGKNQKNIENQRKINAKNQGNAT